MADIKITYESLFDLLRRERNREELQKLEETFYEDVITYLSEKQSLLKMVAGADNYGVSADAEKTRIQFHNIKRILKELYDRREKKIVMLALNAVRTDAPPIDKTAFLPQEQLLYTDITTSCKQHRRSMLDTVLNQTMPVTTTPPEPKSVPATKPDATSTPAPKQEVTKKKDGTTITFTKAVPRFSGGEDQVFGPYNPGETATLPEHIARVLVRKGRAEQA